MSNSFKLNNGVTMGNLLVIMTMVVTVALAWGSISSSVDRLGYEIQQKADNDVVTVKFEFIQQELKEIKELLKERKP